MTEHYVDIIEHDVEKVFKSLGPYDSEHQAEKADRGLNFQIDHGRFYTQIRGEGDETDE